MKVFVINLDSQPERMKFMREQLNKHGVEFERVSAVVGKDISSQDIKKVGSLFWQWCCVGKVMSRNVVGCALSHMGVWRRVVNERIPCACILEDDVTILPEISQQLSKIEKLNNVSENVIYSVAHGHNDGVKTVDGQEGFFRFTKGTNMCGYVVNPTSARHLLLYNTPIVFPCDTWKQWSKWGLLCYKVMPRAVAHWNRKVFGSMNDGDKVDGHLFCSKIAYICKRLIGKPLGVIYCVIRGRQFQRKTNG